MTEIHVIDLIDTTHEGPAAMGPKEEEQQVHLHQGSVDGALWTVLSVNEPIDLWTR